MRAKDVMRPRVYTCAPTDSLEQAAYTMWDWDVSCLVVTDGEQRPVGMISDRDIAMAACALGVALRRTPVSKIMSRQTPVCTPNSSASDVEERMRRAAVRRVPVVDTNGKLIGIVSTTDLMRVA